MMQHPVQQRAGERGIVAEDRWPVLIGFVGGDDGRAAFVTVGDDLEQQVAAVLVDGQIS